MKKNLLSLLLTSTLIVSGLVGISSCGNNNESASAGAVVKDSYKVSYDLNYGSRKPTTATVAHGGKAGYRDQTRTGYTFMGWFIDKECTVEYDFSTPVTSDITLYAKWVNNANIKKYTVTFNMNYGSNQTTSISVTEGLAIKASDFPSPSRLGYTLEGWYTDEALTNKFDESTKITGNITLYAKYNTSSELQTDADGNIVFNNVSINIVNNAPIVGHLSDTLQAKINEFNGLNKGIKVNLITQTDANQSQISLKIHQTEFFLKDQTYYTASDVMDLVGIDFDESKYYTDQIADMYDKHNKTLYTFPLGSIVPTVVYNKALMSKHNISSEPTNVNEFYTKLVEINTAEKAANSNWVGSFITDNDWRMKEIVSHNFYVQNGAPFYEMNAEGKLVNNWYANNQNGANMVSATNLFRKLFINSSTKVGTLVDGDKGLMEAITSGNALMGIAGTSSLIDSLDTSKYGIIPLNKFLAVDKNNAYANKIFVKNVSVGIFKNGPQDLNKIAASAVFASWLSENTEDLFDSYTIPCYKPAQEALNKTSIKTSVNIMKEVGDPSTFMTYSAHKNEYEIFNHQNEALVKQLINVDNSDASISEYVKLLAEQINKLLK